MDEILTIKQRLRHVDEINCKDEIKHFRNENSSKSTITKILSENLSILTNAKYTHSQNETVDVAINDKNPSNVPFEIQKKKLSMLRISKNVNKKDTCDNKVVSTNRFKSLSSNKDDKHAFDKKNTPFSQPIL